MDLTWWLLREGYDAVAADRRARGVGASRDDYRSRLAGHRALVVRSPEGARAFYDESLTVRAGVVPPPLAWLLFGRGAVHGLDGAEHRRRKLLMLETVSAGSLAPLLDRATELVDERVTGRVTGRVDDAVLGPRPSMTPAELHDALVVAYGRAALAWAGIGLPARVGTEVARSLAAIVDGFGFAGDAYLRGWQARRRCQAWAAGLIDRVRTGDTAAAAGSALARLAGSDLDTRVAAVELLNVLRPTVAVAWLATSAAVRLGEAPAWRPRLASGDPVAGLAFAQEVRRTSLFVPLLAAGVSRQAHVGDHVVRRGDRLVLDVVGIHRDPRRWPEPGCFDPGRFVDRMPGGFDLVAQGGGHPSGHRCPGESLTLRLLAATTCVLARHGVEVRTSGVDRHRVPTLPG